MSSEVWILERDLCRCCHAQGIFNNLAEPRGRSSEKEVYSDMLKDSLDISIDPVLGVLSEVTYTICETCILRLKEAFEFKKQVRKCEEKFKDFCNRNAIKVANENFNKLDVKIELPESLSDFRVDSFDDDDDDDNDDFDIFNNRDSKDQTKSDTSPTLDSGSRQKVKNTSKTKAKMKSEQSGGKQSVKEEAADEKKKTGNKSAEKKDSMEDSFDDDDDDDGFHNFDNFDSEDQIKSDTSPTLDSGSRQKVKITKTKAKTKSQQKKGKQNMEEEAADGKKKTENKSAEKKGGQRVIKFHLLSRDYKKVGDRYICSFCDKVYKKLDSLRIHLKYKHYKIPKYSCELCKKGFKTLVPFTVHKLEAHNIDDRFKCNACKDIMFNSKLELRRHINNFHMLGVKHKCKLCDYETFNLENLRKHKFKHKTVKDYHCSFCKKSFLRRSNLKLHERIHTGDRRKVCTVCDQAFVQKSSLNYHMVKYHPEVHF